MRRESVREHARIRRGAGAADLALEERLYDRLKRFDCLSRPAADRVLDWRDGFAMTRQWVGVIQVPGLQLEILPKIDDAEDDPEGVEARSNLLHMLAVGGDVPLRSRDVARLSTRRASLSETLAAIFAERLLRELLRGPERGYRQEEENLRRFKGKLVMAEQARRNAAHRERFFCRYDEFTIDTSLNRAFKWTCRLLAAFVRTPSAAETLSHCLLLLDEVSDTPVTTSDLDAIVITRQNQRFEPLIQFCRLLLAERTSTVEAGRTTAFSLLFDMNKVFERFIAAVLAKDVAPAIGVEVFPQASRRKRYLMTCSGTGVLQLEPDLVIEKAGFRLVMDTKWKRLAPGVRGRGGVSDADLYQLHAYGRRYGCQTSVLLYPHVPGLKARDFHVLNADGNPAERVLIRHVRLHRDLGQRAEREALAAELAAIVEEALEPVRRDTGGAA